MKELIEDFLIYLSAEKGCALGTLSSYKRILSLFHESLLHQNCFCIKEVTKEHIICFLEELLDRGLSSSTRRNNLSVICSFFRFLVREQYLKSNIAQKVGSIKSWNKVPEILSQKEVEQILTHHQNKLNTSNELDDLYLPQNIAILECLYGTGVRISELCNLNLHNISFVEGMVRIDKGKGDKQRIVPIGDRAMDDVKRSFETPILAKAVAPLRGCQ